GHSRRARLRPGHALLPGDPAFLSAGPLLHLEERGHRPPLLLGWPPRPREEQGRELEARGRDHRPRGARGEPRGRHRRPMSSELKSVRLGGRVLEIASPAEDDEYWTKLADGSDDAFWRIAQRLVRPGDVCFDVGANIGVTSLLLAEVEGVAEIHAFEPGPKN